MNHASSLVFTKEPSRHTMKGGLKFAIPIFSIEHQVGNTGQHNASESNQICQLHKVSRITKIILRRLATISRHFNPDERSCGISPKHARSNLCSYQSTRVPSELPESFWAGDQVEDRQAYRDNKECKKIGQSHAISSDTLRRKLSKVDLRSCSTLLKCSQYL